MLLRPDQHALHLEVRASPRHAGQDDSIAEYLGVDQGQVDGFVEGRGCNECGVVAVEILELAMEVRFQREVLELLNVVEVNVAGRNDVRYLGEALASASVLCGLTATGSSPCTSSVLFASLTAST